MKKLLTLCILLLSLTALAQKTESLWEYLPAANGYVNDFEHLFAEDEKATLTDLIRQFELETSVKIAVVTISPANTPKERFEALTLHIAQQWGTGKKGNKNNGILIGISAGFHRIRIQNSDGVVAIITDVETKKIIDEVFVPEFKENKYFNGTLNGLKEIMKLLKERLKK